MRNLGVTELIIIALIILFLFGGKKLPEFIKGLGDAIREFRKASKDNE
jgi:sec-independent protein translocase protein TatA